MVGSSIISASSARIAQKAHSGVSPIIGQQVRGRYDLLWYRIAGRDRAALSAYTEAGIWQRCRGAKKEHPEGEIAWYDQKLEEIERASGVGLDEEPAAAQPAPCEAKPPIARPGAPPIPLGDDQTTPV
jgi:hypothetical protein